MAEHAQHRSADDQYLETPPGSSYEHTDASIGPLVQFALWLIASAIIVHVGLGVLYWVMIQQSVEPAASKQYPLAAAQARQLPPEPRLQQFPRNELYDFRTREEADLHSYGWADKTAGTVHIPIEDAMALMLQRGALSSRTPDAAQAQEPVDMMPSDSSSGRVLEKRRQ